MVKIIRNLEKLAVALCLAVALIGMSQAHAQQITNLSGVWVSNGNYVYRIAQVGNHVTWASNSRDGRISNHFNGYIYGNTLTGQFADDPTSFYHNRGPLTFRIGKNTLRRVNQTAAFADVLLQRQGTFASPPMAQAANAPHAQNSTPIHRPTFSPASDLDKELDNFVAFDSRSWMMNHYDKGSMHNSTSVRSSGATLIATGHFTYNRGNAGWVKIRFVRNKFKCIEFHDFSGICRPLAQSPSGRLLLAGVAAIALDSVSGGGNTGGGNTSEWQREEQQRRTRDMLYANHQIQQNMQHP